MASEIHKTIFTLYKAKNNKVDLSVLLAKVFDLQDFVAGNTDMAYFLNKPQEMEKRRLKEQSLSRADRIIRNSNPILESPSALKT